MDVVIKLQIYILSFLMLLVIYVQLVTAGRKQLLLDQLFKLLILSTMFSTSMEAVSWIFDGQPGRTARIVCIAANSLLLSSNIIPLIIWTLYVDFQIFKDMARIKKRLVSYTVMVLINMLFAVTAPVNGLYFYVDTDNFYHRGALAALTIAVYFGFFIYNILLILKNWKRLSRRNRMPLLLFALPPLLGFLFQMLYYGLTLVWAGVSLSILMVYITVQNNTINTDYLTGLYNRRQLDYHLENRIKGLSKHQSFAGIMVDIDNFKHINDHYGHITGDRAIEATASVLTRYFSPDDFISRYAGDEFVMLFDLKEGELLDEKIDGLRRQLQLYNEKSKEPFKIQLSMGYAIYESGSGQSPDEFLNHLDELMYMNKASKRVNKCL